MSKKLIKIVIGNKKIVKKLDLDTKLNELRGILKNNLPENGNFMVDDAIIEKTDEKDYTIKDIEKNFQIICSINSTSINIYLDNKCISKLDINNEENIESLIKELNGKIPNDGKIKYEDTELTFEEAKAEEMTIKDLAVENSIYFISNQMNQKDDTPKKRDIQELREKQNDKKDNMEPKDDSQKLIHIYKNGEIIKMGLFDIKMNLSSLREIIKNDLSENARFLSDGKGVPINDEKNIQLFYIIKENTIYIEDSAQNKSNNNSKEDKQKIEKIPVILKIDDSTSIIKVSSTDKLDKIREEIPI